MSVIAAVYARKSNDQLGLTDEQKSVTRQVEHARTYAVRKGWTVLDECVFVDDAVSGAEFATRPGFVRLRLGRANRRDHQGLVTNHLIPLLTDRSRVITVTVRTKARDVSALRPSVSTSYDRTTWTSLGSSHWVMSMSIELTTAPPPGKDGAVSQ